MTLNRKKQEAIAAEAASAMDLETAELERIEAVRTYRRANVVHKRTTKRLGRAKKVLRENHVVQAIYNTFEPREEM